MTRPESRGRGQCKTFDEPAWVSPGNRVLMVGAGNIGIIVGYQLLQAGVQVAAVVEGCPPNRRLSRSCFQTGQGWRANLDQAHHPGGPGQGKWW